MFFQSLQTIINRIENQDTWSTHQRFQRIMRRWQDIVGPIVAEKTVPIGLQHDTLLVAVCNSAWAQNLTFERQRIADKISAMFPDVVIADIRFSTTQWHSKQRSPSSNAAAQADSNSQDGNSEIAELWRSHPSQISQSGTDKMKRHLSIVPDAPEAAFQKWATLIQQRSETLSLCPVCQCPTPQGELDRWKRCGLCATKQWTSQ